MAFFVLEFQSRSRKESPALGHEAWDIQSTSEVGLLRPRMRGQHYKKGNDLEEICKRTLHPLLSGSFGRYLRFEAANLSTTSHLTAGMTTHHAMRRSYLPSF